MLDIFPDIMPQRTVKKENQIYYLCGKYTENGNAKDQDKKKLFTNLQIWSYKLLYNPWPES